MEQTLINLVSDILLSIPNWHYSLALLSES